MSEPDTTKRLIIVEDNAKEVPLISEWLGLAKVEFEWFNPNQRLPEDEEERAKLPAQTTGQVLVDLWNRIQETGCRVVLMDLELTKEQFDVTGGALTKEIKARMPGLFVIWITTMPVEQQADWYKKYGADDAWCKPWTPDLTLREGVEQLHNPVHAERLSAYLAAGGV